MTKRRKGSPLQQGLRRRVDRLQRTATILRKQNEETLWTLNILRDSTLSQSTDIRSFANHLVGQVTQFVQCDAGSLATLDESCHVLRLTGAHGLLGREQNTYTFVPGKGFAGRAFLSRELIYSNRPQDHPDFLPFPDQQTPIRCLIACPLNVGSLVVAVLSLHNKQPTYRFHRSDLRRIENLATQLAPVVHSALLSDKLRFLSKYDDLSLCIRGDRFPTIVDEFMVNLAPTHRHGHLIIADLDKFKSINDSLLHESGNKVLAAVGQVLRALHVGRQDDTIVSRLGGDEFAVLLASHSQAEGREHAASIREALESIKLGELGLDTSKLGFTTLGISLGLASFELAGASYREQFREADKLLYEEKYRKKQIGGV